MNFLEAEAYAKQKKAVLPADFYSRAGLQNRGKSFTVSGLSGLDQIQHVQSRFQKALAEGWTPKQFQKAVKEGELDINLPAYRLNNVFRTNLQSAYNAGRLARQYQARATHPFLMFSAVLDERTRDSHRALDGLILSWESEAELIARIYPPLDYQCRCQMISLTAGQAGRYANPERQAQKGRLIDQQAARGFQSGPLDINDLERLYQERLAAGAWPPQIQSQVALARKEVLSAVHTALTIENAALESVSRALGFDLEEGLRAVAGRLAEARRLSTLSQLTAGTLTSREAAVLRRALDHYDNLDQIVTKIANFGYNGANSRDLAWLAGLDSLYANRPSLFLDQHGFRAPLYGQTAALGGLKPGQVIQASAYWLLAQAAPAGPGETLIILKNSYGQILLVDSLARRPALGQALARYGQRYVVRAVEFNQAALGRLWPRVVTLSAAGGQGLTDSAGVGNIAAAIKEGHKLWRGQNDY